MAPSSYAELVLSMSEELAKLADADVDASIERALGTLGGLAGADRAYVFLLADDRHAVSNTHEWCAPGVTPARDALQGLQTHAFPWAFSLLEGLEVLRVPRVEDAPPSPERDEWIREGIRSLCCVPLRLQGRKAGFLGCDWVAREDALGPETVQAVRVTSVLVAGALERRRAYRALERRNRFDQLILGISSRFIHVRPDVVEDLLDDAMQRIARFLDVDTAYLSRAGEDGRPVVARCWTDLRTAEARRAETPDDPPHSTSVEVPLVSGGRTLGFAGFATRAAHAWSDEERNLVQIAGQVLATALGRAEADATEARLRSQLEQTQRLEVVGQLAGGIAHDFNNLLLSITVSADTALKLVRPDETMLREAVEEIREAAERSAALTRHLLTFSRKRAVQVRPVSLNALVEDLLRMVRRLVRESIVIDFRPAQGLHAVNADPTQLEQVVVNLCINASDAMPDGGTLTLETADAHGRVRLVVSDTGTGMTDEVKRHIFEPFFTTKPPGKGSGLGLATAYGIVRQLDGSIDVASAPGRGSTFTVELAALDEPAEEHGARSSLDVRGKETLLLAEDDESARRVVTGYLRRAGFQVVAARDGVEAAELFRARPAHFDLVILDAVMPRMGGLDTYREIVAIRPGVRVLFCSGYGTSEFPEGFFGGGKRELLEKPFDGMTLVRRAREILDR